MGSSTSFSAAWTTRSAIVGIPSLRTFPDPPGLGILRSRTGSGRNVPVLQGGSQVVQEPGHPDRLLDVGDRQAVHAGSVGAPVARDPAERHDQRRRVVHEVEQVIEPAARIGRRPTVKLGLHLRYPRPRPDGSVQPERRHSAARLSALQPPSLLDTAAALPHVPGFPRLGVLRRLRPVPDRSAVGAPSPTSRAGRAAAGRTRDGSRVHCDSLDEGGARLCPCGIATATPQHFTVASRPARRQPAQEFPAALDGGCAPLPAQIRQVRAGANLRDVTRRFLAYSSPSRSPDPNHLAVLARPGFVRAAPTLPGTTRIRLPPASPPCCDRTAAKVSHLHSNQQRLTAHPRSPDTFATLQLGNQQPIKIVSEMMGHSRTAITQDLYTHVSAQMQRRAADALDAVLRTDSGDVEVGSIDGGA